MANNKKISQLNSLPVAANIDEFAIVDTSAVETKKITASNLMTSSLPAEFSVITLGGNLVNEFSTDGTLIGNSDTAIPTERAVKTYVDIAVGDAVKLNIIHTGVDSTGVIGDVLLIDTGSGDIDVELVPTGEGKIVVYKNSTDGNDVIITPAAGSLLDNSPVGNTISFQYTSLEFVCDGTNFYTI